MSDGVVTAAECFVFGFLGALVFYMAVRGRGIAASLVRRREARRRETPLAEAVGGRWIHEGESKDYWARLWTRAYMIEIPKDSERLVSELPIEIRAYNEDGKLLATDHETSVADARRVAEAWMRDLIKHGEIK